MKLDKLGRRTRANERPDDIDLSIIPRSPEREILTFINQHGKANTRYLHAACSYRHISNTQEAVARLFDGGYIWRPGQQRLSVDRYSMVSVYELDKRGLHYLQTKGLYREPNSTSSSWPHDFLSAIVTGAIHIAAKDAGWEFVGRDKIFGIENRPKDERYPTIHGRKLRFDDIFALKNPHDGKWDAYVLEIDRSNEPIKSLADRKDYSGTVDRYREYVGNKLYKEHLGLNTRLINLNVFTAKHREDAYLKLIKEQVGSCSYMATTTVHNFDEYDWQSPKEVWGHLFYGGWNRVGHEPYCLAL